MRMILMAILNYTTTISSEKTAMEIQKKLAAAGAQAILCEYDDNQTLSCISFRAETPAGMLTFRLPAQLDGVMRAMVGDPNVPKRLKNREQASRVAWRILKDWIEAQIAIIEAGMAELAQTFLPYAQDNTGKTVYELVSQSGFKSLRGS